MTVEEARKLYEEAMRNEALSKYNFPTKPSSDGYYHIYVKDSSKKTGRRAIKDKNLDKLKEKVYLHEKGIDSEIRKTFKDIFILNNKNKIKYIKNKEKILSVNNSIRRTANEYNRYFAGTKFERMFIDEITENDISDICYSNLKKLALNTKAFLFLRSILKQVFEFAFKNRWIDENPYLRVDFNIFKGMIEHTVSIEERVHSDEELDRMLDYIHKAQNKNPKYIAPYALEMQIIMGLRRGEVPPLRWSDIKDGYILIHREQIIVLKSDQNKKQECRIVDHTKTWKDRKFPITSDLQDLIDRIKGLGNDSEFIFPNSTGNGTGAIHNNSIYHFYYKMCNKLKIELSYEKRKGPHSYRRNAITKVTNAGGNLLIASKLFGNSPKVADSNYYVGLNLDLAKEYLETGNQR